MIKKPTVVAGERLEDIETALDLFETKIDECGCRVMTATLPQRLSQCLTRALKTIEAQMAAGMDSATFEERHIDPMKELFRRIGEVETEQD